MEPSIDVYLGHPLEEQSEIDFLHQIKSEFSKRGKDAIIFANFFPPHYPRQIDFFIIVENCACLVELKNFKYPISGNINGDWAFQMPDGSSKVIEHSNPYRQALLSKFALTDEVRLLMEQDLTLPKFPGNKPFYTVIEAAVCVYPELPTGSQVPCDYRVRVLGYKNFIDFIERCSRHPNWKKHNWLTLVRHLKLVRQESLALLKDLSVEEANLSLNKFEKRYIDFHTIGIRPLIPTRLNAAAESITTDKLQSILQKGKHVLLIGPSGCGKTHLAKHIGLASIKNDQFVIFTSAKNYEGSLSSLLNYSIAHLHPGSAVDLFKLCSKASKQMALIVDGINECPEESRQKLIQELQALYLQNPMPILITSQQDLQLPLHLKGEKFSFVGLSVDEKKGVFECYSEGNITKDIFAFIEMFQSAYEISLAGESSNEISGPLTRADLFDKYSRRLLKLHNDPTSIRQVLVSIAQVMGNRFMKSLTLAELERVIIPTIEINHEEICLFKETLNCRLLECKNGRCSFRHEMIQDFFEAEALLRTCRDPQKLAAELNEPRKRHLKEFVVGLLNDEESIRSCFYTLMDKSVLRNSLLGELGVTAKTIAYREASDILKKAIHNLEKTEIDIALSRRDLPNSVRLKSGVNWSEYELAFLGAIGQTLISGLFVDEVLLLPKNIDKVFEEQLKLKNSTSTTISSEIFSQLYVFHSMDIERTALATAIIFVACHNDFRTSPNADLIDRLLYYCERLDELTPGALYLICLLLRRSEGVERDRTAVYLVNLCRLCYETGIYHLQLEILQLVQFYRTTLTGQILKEMKNLLSSLETKNLMLSTQLVETLMVYNLAETPVNSDEAYGEVKEIILSPENRHSQECAYAVIIRQFEDVFEGVYIEAIEKLSNSERARLFTMAALGAPTYGWFSDLVLAELLKVNQPSVLPAFLRWATEIETDTGSPHETAACYVLAQIGCAQFMDSPPLLKELTSNDHKAWQIYGEIIFWTSKRTQSETESRKQCDMLWNQLMRRYPFAAVDPLIHFHNSQSYRTDSHWDFQDLMVIPFKHFVRKILGFGLENRDRLSTLFQRVGPWTERERTVFLIKKLGEIGDSENLRLLESLIDSQDYGLDAVQAVKSLKKQLAV